MHFLLPALLLFALGAPASPGYASTLDDCRNLLFARDNDIAAADNACASAVANDPGDDKARLVRAYSRLRRLVEEQVEGPDSGTVTDSVKEFEDALGLEPDTTEGFFPDEDDRRIHHFTAGLQRQEFGGFADGSISACDPYIEKFLEAGDYWIFIGAGYFGPQEAVDGCCSSSGPRTVSNGQIASSSHGDFQVTLRDRRGEPIGNRGSSTLWGSEIGALPLTLSQSRLVRIDVRSWEGSAIPFWCQDWNGASSPAPVDLNGDGEFAFLNASLALARDDGNLSFDDFIAWSFDEGSEREIYLPDGAPGGAEFQQALVTLQVIEALQASVADLEAITDPAFKLTLSTSELAGIYVEDGFDFFGNPYQQPLEFDVGEVRLFEAIAWLLLASLQLSQGIDLDVNVAALTPVGPTIQIEPELLEPNPTFLKPSAVASPSTKFSDAFASLRNAVAAYESASETLWSDSSRDANLVEFAESARGQEARFRSLLDALGRATQSPTPVLCQRSRPERSVMQILRDGVHRDFSQRGAILDLQAMLSGNFEFRNLLPDFTNNQVAGAQPGSSAFPDPFFLEALTPTDASLDCDRDGVPDDGDGSGTAGDAPCSSGQTQGCDDNAPGVANGPSQGTCYPVPWIPHNSLAPGAACMGTGQCEAGHRCSRAQEDSDGDGLGDVFPGAGGRELRVIDEGGLFEYFDFSDEIEPGSAIAFENWGVDTNGNSIAIACGSCDAADFSNPVFGIHPWQDFCGYQSWDTLTSIVLNDDPLCLEVVESGRRYDLDILSFKSFFSGCIDADNGASCGNANGRTSYTRSLFVPEPGLAVLALAALATLAGLRRRKNG